MRCRPAPHAACGATARAARRRGLEVVRVDLARIDAGRGSPPLRARRGPRARRPERAPQLRDPDLQRVHRVDRQRGLRPQPVDQQRGGNGAARREQQLGQQGTFGGPGKLRRPGRTRTSPSARAAGTAPRPRSPLADQPIVTAGEHALAMTRLGPVRRDQREQEGGHRQATRRALARSANTRAAAAPAVSGIEPRGPYAASQQTIPAGKSRACPVAGVGTGRWSQPRPAAQPPAKHSAAACRTNTDHQHCHGGGGSADTQGARRRRGESDASVDGDEDDRTTRRRGDCAAEPVQHGRGRDQSGQGVCRLIEKEPPTRR